MRRSKKSKQQQAGATHQFLAMGKKSVAATDPDYGSELLHYNPSRPGKTNKDCGNNKNHKQKTETKLLVSHSKPSLGEAQVLKMDRHRFLSNKYQTNQIRQYPVPRPDLVESSRRARTLDEIFLSGNNFDEQEPANLEDYSILDSDIYISDKIIEGNNGAIGTETLKSGGTKDIATKSGFRDEDIERPKLVRHVDKEQVSPPSAPAPLPSPKRSFKQRMIHRSKAFAKEVLRFAGLKLFQCVLAVIGGVLTLYPPAGIRDPETGLIVDPNSTERTELGVVLVNGVERAVVADTHFQVICIGLTRMTAFFMYPCLVMVFISKFRATLSFLAKTPFAMYMYADAHELHVYCGWLIVLMSAIHSVGHALRWILQGNYYLFYQHFSGVSGLFITGSCILITIPMTLFRTQIKFEIRKNLHFLFIVFAIALMFHTPTAGIPNGGFTAYVFGIILAWYAADATYCYFFMTEKIETTKFSVLPCGVRMTMAVSDRFGAMGNQGGICYVCLPWIAKNQWHAFSLFENPSNPKERQIFIQKTGDWTNKVHRVLQRETVRPAWVHGPFPSPYDNSISYDNQVLVASGIGITPALSVIRAHKNTRRINLVWAVRDEALLEFFLNKLYLDNSGWNIIYYTGKKALQDECVRLATGNVVIISGRPNLNELIPTIIYGVESGLGRPEKYTPEGQEEAGEILSERLLLAGNGKSVLSDIARDLAWQASELGFQLPAETVAQQHRAQNTSSWMRSSAKKRLAKQMIQQNLSIGFRPWNYHDIAQSYVRNLDKSMILSTWGILYCGGAKPVLQALEDVSDEYDIGLHIESFAW